VTSVEQANTGRAIQGRLSFDDRLQNATIIESASLEDKKPLIGVPMLITRVTYRPKGKMQERGYVSVEAMIGDLKRLENAIRRGWIPNVTSIDNFAYDPEETVVFNDGGTGIRRQLTMILHSAGLLDIGQVLDDGSFDQDWTGWDSFSSVGKQKIGDDEIEIPDFRGLDIYARRGLRASQYDMDGQPAETYYLS
jgi:hypothetical protein